MLDLDWIANVTKAKRARKGQRVQSLWDGYGEIVRIDLVDPAPEDAPSSVIAKWVKPPARSSSSNRSDARKRRSYEVETTFYRSYADRCDAQSCRVAKLLDSRVDNRTDERVLLLEDLDDAGFGERRRLASTNELDACLAWLASFHARFLGVEPKGLWSIGTYWHLATRPDELAAIDSRYEDLRRAAPIIDRRLNEAKYRTLVHGDAKLANFCFGARSSVAAVDFQYVGGGCGMKDVAYLINGEPAEQRHLERYFAHLRDACASHRPEIDVAELESTWRDLYPLACVDFFRFLAGWGKSYWERDSAAQRLAGEVLAGLEGIRALR